MIKENKFQITSLGLHIMAMFFMLLDHMWATIIRGNMWMTSLGRLAFPIFAFMIVEGYFHTSDFKAYVKRLFILALISEIPFNLMTSASLINPFEQNVIWTLLAGLLLIYFNERFKDSKPWLRVLVGLLSFGLAYLLGKLMMADYYYAGIFVVLSYYFFRERNIWNFLGQLLALAIIFIRIMDGLEYPISLFGLNFSFPQQGFALLAQIPIWLYRGKQGRSNKFIKYFNYLFYPVHMLILSLISLYLL